MFSISILCGLLIPACGKINQGSELSPADADQLAELPANEPAYFEEVSTATAKPPTDEAQPLRYRYVKANVEALKETLRSGRKAMRLDLFADTPLNVSVEDVQILSPDNIVMTGRILGKQLSSVSLVIRKGIVMSNIHQGAESSRYSLEYTAAGTHLVRETMDYDSGDCKEVHAPAPDAGDNGQSIVEGAGEEDLNRAQTTTGAKIIDMLVAYTPSARSVVGGTDAMIARIQMGIADTNRAFSNSGVKLAVRLAGTIETRSNDTGDFSYDLDRLRGKYDGRWDEVHAKRAAVGADQVTLVGRYYGSSTAGIGFIRATSSSAFTIVKYSTFNIYTFSHELGHNIGLQHSDGYVNSSAGFRTIMAYGSYPRILRFSNPYITYNGYRTGTSSQYSVSKLNSYGPTVSGFVATKFSSSTAVDTLAQSIPESLKNSESDSTDMGSDEDPSLPL